MDQLRTALVWLKKHHFWVLCGVGALLGLLCWWSGTKKFAAAYDTNQKTITAQFGSLQAVLNTAFHPNDDINKRQQDEIGKQAEDVKKLWQQLYDRQRERVLKWPVPPLSKEFGDYVDKLQFGAEIPPDLRSNYQNYVQGHFPDLPKQVGARVYEVGEGAAGPGGPVGRVGMGEGPGAQPAAAQTAQDQEDYICDWQDQNYVRAELDFPQRPTSLKIWVTQEDLWVIRTLLDVIAKTNQAAGTTRMSNAAVKTIKSLEVGQRAANYSRQPGRLVIAPETPATGGPGSPSGPGAPPGAAPGGETAARGGPGGRPGPEGGGPGGTALTPEQENASLLAYRYLDDKGMPLPAAGGAAAPDATAPATTPAAAAPAVDMSSFGIGYKRLPVRMVLEMDAGRLPELMTQCANQPLRVEVQELRINTPDAIAMTGGGPAAGMFSSRGPGGGGAAANLFPEHNGIQNFSQQPNVVTVVIQGTIYIFNKPDPNLLQPPAQVASN